MWADRRGMHIGGCHNTDNFGLLGKVKYLCRFLKSPPLHIKLCYHYIHVIRISLKYLYFCNCVHWLDDGGEYELLKNVIKICFSYVKTLFYPWLSNFVAHSTIWEEIQEWTAAGVKSPPAKSSFHIKKRFTFLLEIKVPESALCFIRT